MDRRVGQEVMKMSKDVKDVVVMWDLAAVVTVCRNGGEGC